MESRFLCSGAWPVLSVALRSLSVPAEVTVEQLCGAEIELLVSALRDWYPALAVGEEAVLLSRDFYLTEVALAGGSQAIADHSVLVVVGKAGGHLACCLVLEAEEQGRALLGRMTVVSPTVYGKGFGALCAQIVAAVGQAMGAERASALAELDNHGSRKALEGAGFVLSGMMPASDRKQHRDGTLRYVAEAIYVHPLVPIEHRILPLAPHLSNRSAAVFHLLFGDHSSSAVALPEVQFLPLRSQSSSSFHIEVSQSRAGCWPTVQILSARSDAQPVLKVRQLRRTELATYSRCLRAWNPTLVGSNRESLLHHAAYASNTAFDGEIQDLAKRPLSIWILEESEVPVGICTLSYVASRASMDIVVCAIAPTSNSANVSELFHCLLASLAKALGIIRISGFVSLRNREGQQLYEKLGLQLLGIIPTADRYCLGDRMVYGMDALFGRSLVPHQDCHLPSLEKAPPRLAALTQFMCEQGTLAVVPPRSSHAAEESVCGQLQRS